MPYHQSELLYEALKRVRSDATFYKIAGAGHGSPEFNSDMMRAAVQAFFDKHLKPPSDGSSTAPRNKEPVVFTTTQDRQNMLDQLGITKLRPGRDSNSNSPNAANYDEAKANPYPKLPALLETKGGKKITSAEQWWKERRPEIVEMLEREVYGRIPENVPKVKWEVRETREVKAGGKPAIQRHIVGVVHHSDCPGIEVNISMSLTLPKEAAGPVPVLMSFGWTPFEQYSAEESSFGSRTADDLPVDSHMTLALCAPRLTFISHGIPERGDAHWLDHQGSFMATIAAQPVFRLLGARDLGRSDDFMSEKMPAVNVDLLDGALAWRQHDGGHTDGPNVEHFIRWAEVQWGKGKTQDVSASPEPDRRSLKDAVGDRFKIGVGVSYQVVQQPEDAALIRKHFQHDPYKDRLPEAIQRKQIKQYVELFKLFDEFNDLIERVSFWNLHDGQSWLNYFPWNRVNYPLLFDRNRRPKPAFDAVYAVLRTPRSAHAPVERHVPIPSRGEFVPRSRNSI